MRSPSRSVTTLVLLAVLSLAACKKQSREEAPGPPQPAPEAVVATVSVRAGAPVVVGLRAFIDAFKPGTGAILSDGQALAILATLVGVSSLDGVDLAGPLHLVIADDGQARGAVFVGRALPQGPKERSEGGASVLVHGGWVVAGPDPLVELTRAYAISTLVKATPPEALTLTVDLPRVLTRYRTQIDQARAMLGSGMPGMPAATSKIMTAYIDGLLALGADVTRVQVVLDVTGERGSMALGLAPRAGTRLADFVAAQKPTDQALLTRLPASTAPIVASARLVLGPYREGLMTLFTDMLGELPEGKDFIGPLTAFMAAATGDVAATMSMSMDGGGMTMFELFGISDDDAARQAITGALTAIGSAHTVETLGIRTTVRATPNAGSHDGVTLGSYASEIDLSTMPAGQAAVMPKQPTAFVGVFDHMGLVAMAAEGLPAAARAIDAARGKVPTYEPGPRERAQLADSLGRKESMIMLMDFGRLLEGMPGVPAMPFRVGVGFGVGFADGNATFRMFATPG